MLFTTFIVKYIISIVDWTKTIKKIQAIATVIHPFGLFFCFFFFDFQSKIAKIVGQIVGGTLRHGRL